MPNIPSSINGVTVDFAPSVNRNVVQRVIDALRHVVSPDVAQGHTLARIWVSSARRQNPNNSRHNVGKAVDISRINGVRMSSGFGSDPQVTAIVRALQQKFESFEPKRENFGPALKLKEGEPFQVGGHQDHIHFSVD
jgi:hypothetical protein